MRTFRTLKPRQALFLCIALLVFEQPSEPRQSAISAEPQAKFPYPETLVYRVGWRMVTAGQATLRLTRATDNGWQFNLDLTSAGIVNQLYRVVDNYKLTTNEKFCGFSVNLDAQEGKHHAVTAIAFDNQNHKLAMTVQDLVTHENHKTDLAIPPCTYDIAGALMMLRASQVEPGMKFTIPVTNGKKLANVRAEGLSKEKVTVAGKTYNTIRYETFVFDNVLYRRKGRLLIWATDDPQRLPVQMRFVFGFPLGDITLELEKVEKL
jgi:hypothetical protein